MSDKLIMGNHNEQETQDTACGQNQCAAQEINKIGLLTSSHSDEIASLISLWVE